MEPRGPIFPRVGRRFGGTHSGTPIGTHKRDPEGTHFLGGYLRVPWGDPFLNLRGIRDSKRGPMFLKEF